MTDPSEITKWFEDERAHLLAVAYRMLGSLREAENAVQETRVLASAVNVDAVDNVGNWLTTVVGRVCLNTLRERHSQLDNEVVPIMPDPIVSPPDASDPERATLNADTIGLSMLVILDTIPPDERLAFVLHDVFGVPFRDIASILERSLSATRTLASRARQRVQAAPTPDLDLDRQRLAVDAFFAAAQQADSDAIAALLHPDVVLRSDGGRARPSATTIIRGAETVAESSVGFAELVPFARPALVNGEAGVVAIDDGKIACVVALTVTSGGIAAIEVLADSDRLDHIDAAAWS